MGSRRKWDDEPVDRPRAARSRRPMDDDLPPSRSSSRSGRGGPDAPPSRGRADYPGGGGQRPPRREEDDRSARPRSPGGGGGSSDRRRYDDAPPPRSSRSSSREDYDMRPRGGARPPSRGGWDEMDAPRRPRGPAPMPDARGMRPPQQRPNPNREWRDWDDDEDDEPAPGGQALKALGVMILFFAIGVGAAFGYYRMSAPKVVGEETPVTTPSVSPSASPSGSPSASPSATKTSFHFDPTGSGGAYIAVVAE
jgi:hypothetical protein